MCECTRCTNELKHTFMILYAIIRVKSSLSKSIMQQSIYPVGRRWTFSTSQL